jgi:hypothetical protein
MKTITLSILASLLLVIAAPAYSESTHVIQIYRCEFNNDDTEEDDVLELAADWLKAARQMKGGANLELAVRFPIAIGNRDDGDFTWVITTPTFAEWGEFTDAYPGSGVEKIDDRLFDKFADCGQSTIWEGVAIE